MKPSFRRIPMHVLAAGLLVAPAAAPPAAVADDDFHWTGKVAQGKTVEIYGVSGDVIVDAADRAEVEVSAQKFGRSRNFDEVEIQVVEHDDGITVCAVYPTKNGREATCEPGEGAHGRIRDTGVGVDFEVHVPKGVHVVARTVNGDVEAVGIDGNLSGSTVNGSVLLETTGVARASSVNGSIRARMGSADWDDDLELSTVNGKIHLEVPAETDADLEIETVNGSIDLQDFPVHGRMSRTRFRGEMGKGGPRLKLSSVNGSIEIRAL